MIPCINAFDTSVRNFYDEYLLKNKPCIISDDVTTDWRSRLLWVTQDGKPDFSYLKAQFGSSVAPVANCKTKHYNTQLTNTVTVSDYTDYWQKYIDNDYSNTMDCLYLKDWHFEKEFPDYSAYSVPKYFTSDWLNEYCKHKTVDDYDFVYMGPKGSWTPFHADVFRSYSWSANICGMKRWLLCPPGVETKLADTFGNLPYDLKDVNTEIPEIIEVIQGPGEVIFVPSNWHHQVYNLEDTISINRNWFNATNVDIVFDFLTKSLEDVQNEINDCKDMDGWDQQCQIILKASQGMDFNDFYHLLEYVAQSRISIHITSRDNKLNEYELRKLKDCLQREVHQKYVPANSLSLIEDISSLLQDIDEN